MNILTIFQTNWLDFLTWTLAGCMGIAFLVHLVERLMPSEIINRTQFALKWPKSLRKAS